MTQGYYFTQLLGLEDKGFNPLNDHAFADSVFYLDTNILLVGILYADENAALFNEVVNISHRIGIELRVTRATINEARRVAADRLPLMKQIINVVPEELIEQTDDQFLLAYLYAKKMNAALTPEEFLEPFDHLPETLETKWQIAIDDRTEEEILKGRDFTRVAEIMNEEAENSRGWGKSELVLEHDVCHYVLVCDERATKPKTWFLTRDRALALAGTKLAGNDQVFCFSLLGFLHSISPFLTTPTEEHTFVDMFSTILSEQVFPVGSIFEARELALMAEYHEDVMATPVEQLVMAFDFIKSKTLQGKPYKRKDIPEVSLELRKFLASSREEQMQALEAERARSESERQAEQQKRNAAEEATRRRDAKIEGLIGEVAKLQADGTETQKRMQSEIDVANTQLANQQAAQEREKQQRRAFYMALGFIGGLALWNWGDSLQIYLNQRAPVLLTWASYVKGTMKLLGAFVFSIPAFLFIRRTSWRHELQLGLYALVIIAGLVFSQLLDKDTIAAASNYVTVGSLIAALVFAMLVIDRKK